MTGLSGAAVPAWAHEHPSGITDLVTPALVRVEAVSHVKVTLLDHIGKLQHVERSYDVPIGTGTGFVVNPEGAVVTLTNVVKTDDDVAVYAANKIFAEHHKVDIDDDFDRHTLKDELLNRHLQECYPPKTSTTSCLTEVSTRIKIFPNILPTEKEGISAEIAHTGDQPEAPAVLLPTGRAEGGTGMPTAPLAVQVPDKAGSPVSVAGFTGRPAADRPHTIDIAHLDAGGSGSSGRPFKNPEGKVDEPAKMGALIDKGLSGAPVIGDKDGAVVGVLAGGGSEGRMIGVREVTKALAEAKVKPRRGPIDAAFEVALTRFHTKYYGDAVPALGRVLELYPGHVIATRYLKTAQEKRDGKEDAGAKAAVPPSTGGGIPLWPFIAGAGLLVLIVLGVALLLLRRRAKDEDTGVPTSAPASAARAPMVPEPVASAAPPTGPSTGPSTSPSTGPSTGPPTGPRMPVPSPGEDPSRGEPSPTDVTRIVSRASFPAPSAPQTGPIPAEQGGAQSQPLLTARPPVQPAQPSKAPVSTTQQGATGKTQRFCTACGMGMGPAHRFCGYCGHPAET
ncbi:hypothetical protein [Spongiactinospora sp. TRM90649]|uniref:hypothetical protein n=1 Tax=Spongiactinospora sp. TRM90649 TaxID=3031114 RepID=UPI0023F9CFB6|nr:hypothetical protein [Spongiactinospora sp. TRM90649]MDF5755707.1 hypothetical protein [Spongiactinospora sp. TRM90649]